MMTRRIFLKNGSLALVSLGFAPAFMQRLFRRRLHRYEMRDILGNYPPRDVIGIPELSGNSP